MKRIFVMSLALALGGLAFADPADACHHRRHRRHGCHHGGGCGNGGYAPAYYDTKGSNSDYGPAGESVPAPPPPPPVPRAT